MINSRQYFRLLGLQSGDVIPLSVKERARRKKARKAARRARRVRRLHDRS